MSETSIQWTATRGPDGRMHPGFTFNGWIGCSRVSAECDNCYADAGSKRLAAQHHLTLWDEGSSRYFTGADYWKKPAAWNRKAEKLGVRLKVFCASFSDVFEDRPDLVASRARLGGIIADTPWLDWLLLTKRPQNIMRLAEESHIVDSLTRNVWLGTTVGLQSSVQRAVDLVRGPGAVQKFLSMEPLLGDVNLDPAVCPDCWGLDGTVGDDGATLFCPECGTEMGGNAILDPLNGGVSWLIVGGESGPKARPLRLPHMREAMRQARAQGVAVFVKQMGRWIEGEHRGFRVDSWLLADGRIRVPGVREEVPPAGAVAFSLFDKHGGSMHEWPKEYRVREYPEVAA
jgi:protein gp37